MFWKNHYHLLNNSGQTTALTPKEPFTKTEEGQLQNKGV